MDVDIAELLRPSPSDAPGFVDLDDLRRRVRRRRRTRAALTAAVLLLAVPLVVQRLPSPTTNIAFPGEGQAVGDGGADPAAQDGIGGTQETSAAEVLESHDIEFTPKAPSAAAVSEAAALRAARRYVGAAADDSSASAEHGMMTQGATPGADAQAVWAVFLPQWLVAPGGPAPPDPTPRGASVVLLDASTGDVIMMVSLSEADDGQQQASASAPVGQGSAGGSAAPARRSRASSRGRSPRRAAVAAARAMGRTDLDVVSVVFIAPTDTRVLVEDSTGCWVYTAVDTDRDGTWKATGGEITCDP